MKILTAAEMGATDRATEEHFGIPLADLMERAGAAVARFVQRQYPAAKHVAVLAGTGNNGGDGFVAARHLQQAGVTVEVHLVGEEAKLKGIALAAFSRLDRSVIRLVSDEQAAQNLAHALEAADVILDAVTGTGFQPPLRGIAVAVRDVLARATAPVVAVDLPSGWDADSTAQSVEGAFRADAVVTFTAPKLAHAFGRLTTGVFGPVTVAPIGSPDEAIVSETNLVWTGTAKRIFEAPRVADSNKGMYGHVLIVGGAYGKAGAPSMSSLAALRTGAGLVTAAVPKSILNTVALITPELMTQTLEEDAQGSIALSNIDNIDRLTKKITVIAIGPGMGTEGEAPEFVHELVAKTTVPLVIDADGLNAFKGKADLLKQAAQGGKRPIVLTPHPGEMSTLLGITTKQVQADRLNIARRFATEFGVTLVLKGWRTLVAHPDGTVAVNTTGNPAMAKGGSGDILTGIVAACLAQQPNNVGDAVNAAVYLHGLAADFAAHDADEHTILATDTVAHLSAAFRYRTRDAEGNEWLCGLRQ